MCKSSGDAAIDGRDHSTKSIETTQLISGQVLGDDGGGCTELSVVCRHKSDAIVTTSGWGSQRAIDAITS